MMPRCSPQPARHPRTEVTPEKIQAFPAFPEVNDLRLVRVQLQPEIGENVSHRVQSRPGLPLTTAEHHTIVGVAHQLTHLPRGEPGVQDVQKDVGQQRGDHPALRSTRDRPRHPTLGHHPCSQPQPQQLEHPAIRHPAADQFQQPLMIDPAEEITDVELHDMSSTLDEPDPKPFHRLRGGPFRPEPIRARQEIRLEDRFQHELDRLLRHPVPHRGYPQRPLAALWFRDLHPPHWRRAIPACLEVIAQLTQHAVHAIDLHRAQGDPIHPGRALVRSDSFPRLPQDVTPVDTVEQGVETPTRRLLGRSP